MSITLKMAKLTPFTKIFYNFILLILMRHLSELHEYIHEVGGREGGGGGRG